MPRVRFAGFEDPPTVAEAAEDAWGSDEETDQLSNSRVQHHQQHQQPRPAAHPAQLQQRPASQSHQQADTSLHKQQTQHAAQQQQCAKQQELPSLQQLCLAVLGQHITELVEQLEGQLGWLPSDVKAALLAIARRREELTGAMLLSLADEGWKQLDVSGCSRLFGSDLLQAAGKLRQLHTLDVTGCERLSAGGWKKLAQACPGMRIIRLGGSQLCNEEALKALPHILPGISQPSSSYTSAAAATTSSTSKGKGSSSSSGVARKMVDSAASEQQQLQQEGSAAVAAASPGACFDSWEDAFASSDSEDEQPQFDSTQQQFQHGSRNSSSTNASVSSSSSSSGGGSTNDDIHQRQCSSSAPAAAAAAGTRQPSCKLQQLEALIWPDVPSAAVQLVLQRCPRVAINPPVTPDKLTGQLPPPAFDPSTALDEPFMQLVGPGALSGGHGHLATAARAGRHGHAEDVSIAELFIQAYIQRAERLRKLDQKLAAAEQRKQLKASHALRAVDAWLDEA